MVRRREKVVRRREKVVRRREKVVQRREKVVRRREKVVRRREIVLWGQRIKHHCSIPLDQQECNLPINEAIMDLRLDNTSQRSFCGTPIYP